MLRVSIALRLFPHVLEDTMIRLDAEPQALCSECVQVLFHGRNKPLLFGKAEDARCPPDYKSQLPCPLDRLVIIEQEQICSTFLRQGYYLTLARAQTRGIAEPLCYFRMLQGAYLDPPSSTGCRSFLLPGSPCSLFDNLPPDC